MDLEQKINIAIDGPAGAGKSTIARLVSEQLGYVYVDTGAMYRVVALSVLEHGLPFDDEQAIAQLTQRLHIEFKPGASKQEVWVDGRNITDEIRSNKVTSIVSQIASIAKVRACLADVQRRLAAAKGVVMDGRDIGTQVLPDAEVKIFLTASAEVRAQRRLKELPPGEMTLHQLMEEIEKRDHMDRNRSISPLVAASDAIMIDSTALTIDEVVDSILKLCRSKKARE